MIYELQEVIRSVGFEPPESVIAGKVKRFSTNGKKSDKSGWVFLFPDGEGASFGCWRTGEVYQWQAKRDKPLAPDEQEAMRRQFEEAKAKAKQELEESYKLAANEAKAIYDTARPALEHDYLSLKGIRPNMTRIFGGKLIIPVYGADGNLQSIQSIFSDGTKRFHAGGKMQGGHCWIGDPKQSSVLLVAEGFATADSLAQATGYAVCIAFNAGNLKPVTDMIHHQYSDKRMIICADNDKHGKGAEKAHDTGYEYIVCPIDGDFNDMALQGLDAVAKAINGVPTPKGLLISVADMMAAVKKPDWLIKNIIERGSMNLLFGESGAGKSLFALDWAFCIGNGINWHNHKVKQAAQVIYIAGEGHRGLTLRMKALSQKYNEQPENIFFSQRSVNLLDEAEALAITKIVDDMSINPSIIFIDTLHRNMIGDENKSDDMAKFLKCIELLISKTGCAVMLVHHSGHGDKTRARGSSAIKAAMDAEFCVSKEGMTSIMTCTKSKDFDAGQDIRFGILPVELEGDLYYDDDEQKQITSVYLEYIGSAEKETKMGKNDQIVLDSLRECVATLGKNGNGLTILGEDKKVVVISKWRMFAYDVLTGKNPSRDFDIAKKSLKTQRLINNDGDYWWIE
jgi:phage/plasmid primase-like uncharacterized protein/archaellum biogenesis ATPase FlaH